MRIGIAADHGGYALKNRVSKVLQDQQVEVIDFGAEMFDPNDDYPDFVTPLARAVARQEVARGVAICGSGVGACVTANKVRGVRAALITVLTMKSLSVSFTTVSRSSLGISS